MQPDTATAVAADTTHYGIGQFLASSLSVVGMVAGLAFGLLLLWGVLYVYFWPSIYAGKVGHRSVRAIHLVNMFLGWSVVGWFWALVWANTSPGAHAEPQPSPQPQRACLKCGVMNPLSGAFCSSCGAPLGPQP